MRHYLKARKALTVVAVVTFVLVIGGLLGGSQIELPAVLGGGSSPVPIAILLPVAVAVALAFGLDSRERPQELVTARRRDAYDAAFALGVLGYTAIGTRLWPVTGSAVLDRWFLRNCALMVGLVLVAAAFGRCATGAALCAVLLLATTSYGPGNPAAGHLRVLQVPPPDTWCTAIAGMILATGVLLLLAPTHRIIRSFSPTRSWSSGRPSASCSNSTGPGPPESEARQATADLLRRRPGPRSAPSRTVW